MLSINEKPLKNQRKTLLNPGIVFNVFGEAGVTGFNLYSILVATVGAVILIWIGRMIAVR